MTTQRSLLKGAVIAVAFAAATATATPAGATTTSSDHAHSASFVDRVNDPGSENDLAPCYTAPGSISGTSNTTDHVVQLDNGGFHTTQNDIGTLVLTPDDPSLPVLVGHYTLHFSFTGVAGQVGSWASNFELSSSPGTPVRFHVNGQFRVLPDGELQHVNSHYTCG